jgi:hypothetical protein
MTETRTSNPGQVADGHHHPNFWLYAVENIRQGDPGHFRLLRIGGERRSRAAWRRSAARAGFIDGV